MDKNPCCHFIADKIYVVSVIVEMHLERNPHLYLQGQR